MLSWQLLGFGVCVLLWVENSHAQRSSHRRFKPDLINESSTPCELGSCYPLTGNLLIGRESNLTASSTCGIPYPENYCIVSHLEVKKCFRCDSRSPTDLSSHRIQNVIYKSWKGTNHSSWWQSKNGVENVTIRLDLDSQYHFTHLIMQFRTFPPAAMIVERSHDFGKTWKIYRYMAINCREAFPQIPTVQRSVTDIFCEPMFPRHEPIKTNGEVILRILNRKSSLAFSDPYSESVQELLKMTNLRVNFTKLFTLGDDLLDKRHDIQEKYYYAIHEMTVRGSCWCYGHAHSCLPVTDSYHGYNQDMIHGRCECTHNTKGLNCQECEDLYNDRKWRPAFGYLTNACEKCQCHEHATKCRFDENVYMKSGNISGGVCEDCMHNTWGIHCEKCQPHYFHDPFISIDHPNTCIPCLCDTDGTVDDGLCDSEDKTSGTVAGQCHCKENVEGLKCDKCKPGFWNFSASNPDGCQPCTCDPRGTVPTSMCDPYTGECHCKQNVVGKDCNQCLVDHWNLEAGNDGCKPCNCNLGGSEHTQCDMITGFCKCIPHVTGRTCNVTEQEHYMRDIRVLFEAEDAVCVGICQKVPLERPRDGQPPSWTGDGYVRTYSGLNFPIRDLSESMEYDIVIKHRAAPDRLDGVLNISRGSTPEECVNSSPENDVVNFRFNDDLSYTKITTVCLEAGHHYTVQLELRTNNNLVSPTASILVDSIALVPSIDMEIFHGSPIADLRRREFEYYDCAKYFITSMLDEMPQVCRKYFFTISSYVFKKAYACDCDPTGSNSALCNPIGGACDCKTNVVGRKCDRCAIATYGFDPNGCKACDCNSQAIDNFCDVKTGQCSCANGTHGRACGECQPGFWNFPNCERCQCHNHGRLCDSKTGYCLDCQGHTTGHYCDKCEDGYYGDPVNNLGLPCKPCRCPDTIDSGHSHAPRCYMNGTDQVICKCNLGYTGSNCDMCDENYFGHPERPGGTCKPCDCNNNIDLYDTGNCDPFTGKCLKCLNYTTGDHCEICLADYFRDPESNDCISCNCNILGTDKSKGPCDSFTGQCHCHQNVTGRKCDECIENHWRIGKGEGCIPCDCDPVGSLSSQCDTFTGACTCRPAFGGDKCDECLPTFYGDPKIQCIDCDCNLEGSERGLCHQNNGTCICKSGIGGEKCDKCARGFNGVDLNCQKCHECFYNWDTILNQLSEKTDSVIQSAKEIKRTGATGAYNSQFEKMDDKIKLVQDILSETTKNAEQLNNLQKNVDDFRKNLNGSADRVAKVSSLVQNRMSEITLTSIFLEELSNKSTNLKNIAVSLRDNATKLQEKDIKGAYNLTKEAGKTSEDVRNIEKTTSAILKEATQKIKRTESLLKPTEDYPSKDEDNEMKKSNLDFQLNNIKKKIPQINAQICGGSSNNTSECDLICGGAGCNKCGGISCESGAVGKAVQGQGLVNENKINLNAYVQKSKQLLRYIKEAAEYANTANKTVEEAHEAAVNVRKKFKDLLKKTEDMNSNLTNFNLDETKTVYNDIKQMSNEVLAMKIKDTPSDILERTKKIDDISLRDVDETLQKSEQLKAKKIKEFADNAKSDADDVLSRTRSVLNTLNNTNTIQNVVSDSIQSADIKINSTWKDIEQVRKNIDQIFPDKKERDDAYSREIKELEKTLHKLRNDNAKNDHDSNILATEESNVVHKVANLEKRASDLRVQYDSLFKDLNNKSQNVQNSKERARKLHDKASILSSKTEAKFKELQDEEAEFIKEDKKLDLLSNDVDELLNKIEHYVENISHASKYYENCRLS